MGGKGGGGGAKNSLSLCLSLSLSGGELFSKPRAGHFELRSANCAQITVIGYALRLVCYGSIIFYQETNSIVHLVEIVMYDIFLISFAVYVKKA